MRTERCQRTRGFGRWAIVVAVLVACGCSDDDREKNTMPSNSPTQSVEAAESFNEGNKLRQTDKPAAIAAYTRAIEADPKFEFAYYNRALTLAEEFRIAEARKDLDTLKALGSERVETLESLIAVAEDLASEQKDPSGPSASRPCQ